MSDLSYPDSPEAAEKNREALHTPSKTAWKKQAVHRGVVLPSGAVISVKVPNLSALAQAGEIPNQLVDLATASANSAGEDIPEDALKKLGELQNYLVSITVHEPKITQADVPELPAEDIGFITEIAYRQRDLDAVGNSISGLDRVQKYATFRDDHDSDEDLLDA